MSLALDLASLARACQPASLTPFDVIDEVFVGRANTPHHVLFIHEVAREEHARSAARAAMARPASGCSAPSPANSGTRRVRCSLPNLRRCSPRAACCWLWSGRTSPGKRSTIS
jgi:hypothetical protein